MRDDLGRDLPSQLFACHERHDVDSLLRTFEKRRYRLSLNSPQGDRSIVLLHWQTVESSTIGRRESHQLVQCTSLLEDVGNERQQHRRGVYARRTWLRSRAFYVSVFAVRLDRRIRQFRNLALDGMRGAITAQEESGMSRSDNVEQSFSVYGFFGDRLAEIEWLRWDSVDREDEMVRGDTTPDVVWQGLDLLSAEISIRQRAP